MLPSITRKAQFCVAPLYRNPCTWYFCSFYCTGPDNGVRETICIQWFEHVFIQQWKTLIELLKLKSGFVLEVYNLLLILDVYKSFPYTMISISSGVISFRWFHFACLRPAPFWNPGLSGIGEDCYLLEYMRSVKNGNRWGFNGFLFGIHFHGPIKTHESHGLFIVMDWLHSRILCMQRSLTDRLLFTRNG